MPKLKHEVTNVQVMIHGDSYTLGCAYDGARYRVWVSRTTLLTLSREYREGPAIYKNPPEGTPYQQRPRPGDAYFRTRKLGAQTKFGSLLIAEMRRIADRDQLWKAAEERRLEEECKQEEEHKVAVAKHRQRDAGPVLYVAAKAALVMLKAVQAEDDPHGMPWVEIQQLEDAITLADEGPADADERRAT